MPKSARRSDRARARLVAPTALLVLAAAFTLALASAPPAAAAPAASGASGLRSPAAWFGHPMGADRTLVTYDEEIPYFEYLASASDRVALERIGRTLEGRDLLMVIVSSPENLARLDRYRAVAARLDDPRGLGDAGVDSLVAGGKVFLFVSLNIHSTEIASSQMAPEWVWRLASGGADTAARWLDDVVVLLLPSTNPDGQVMVADWYREQLGTPYEGSAPPRLYHRYAGHDDNRDWFMLNLPETRAVNHALYHRWFPQIVIDEHQMGTTGPRLFVPPYTEPLAAAVHPLILREAGLLGAAMALDLQRAGKPGVVSGYQFDAYWPGGMRSMPWWKNTVGVLTEAASVRLATPVEIDPRELAGDRKGLPDYRAQVNFPDPWPGGTWRLRDIVDYELLLSDSALRTAALHRADFLSARAAMARDAVRRGGAGAPYAWILPPDQHDPGAAARLADLLRENGAEVFRAGAEASPAGAEPDGARVPPGSLVVPAAQPYRPFLVEMLGRQTYPEVRQGPGTEAIYPPYDVTAWSLPDFLGVTVQAADRPLHIPLEPLEGPAWNRAPLQPGPGDLWALSPAETEAYPAVFRLLARGHAVRQVHGGFQGAGRRWPAGTFLVDTPEDTLRDALRGLRASAVRVPAADALGSPGPGAAVPRRLRLPRVGIYQSWLAPMDEGWTRFVLDASAVPYTVLHNADIAAGDLADRFDVILLPHQSRAGLVQGFRPGGHADPPPPPYDRGLAPVGVRSLRRFVENGGTLVALGAACVLPLRDFGLPLADRARNLSRDELLVPGTLLRVEVDRSHPLAYGLPAEAALFVTGGPVPAPLPNGAGASVAARYAPPSRLLVSGWVRGREYLAGAAPLLETRLGRGRVVLMAFRPQFRAQTVGTFRVLLNAILEASGDGPDGPEPVSSPREGR